LAAAGLVSAALGRPPSRLPIAPRSVKVCHAPSRQPVGQAVAAGHAAGG
jgi:hypothetical protein